MALTITIGADASQLRAQLAVAQSEMRATTRELNSLANTARRAGDDLSFAKVGQAASHFNAVTAFQRRRGRGGGRPPTDRRRARPEPQPGRDAESQLWPNLGQSARTSRCAGDDAIGAAPDR